MQMPTLILISPFPSVVVSSVRFCLPTQPQNSILSTLKCVYSAKLLANVLDEENEQLTLMGSIKLLAIKDASYLLAELWSKFWQETVARFCGKSEVLHEPKPKPFTVSQETEATNELHATAEQTDLEPDAIQKWMDCAAQNEGCGELLDKDIVNVPWNNMSSWTQLKRIMRSQR
ncbi:unnamed protein product [Caretta caretta]